MKCRMKRKEERGRGSGEYVNNKGEVGDPVICQGI
jgi:hypothetical protein